jgi:glycosyltransferase involved in cell wall biosynthesis
MSMRVSIIVPVFNEEKTILQILEKVAAQRVDGVEFEVVVVDDGSRDGTAARLEERPDLYSRFVRRPHNGGKGAAVTDGLRVATGDYILFQDADLEYDPADYARLVQPALDHQADVVMGSRFLAPQYTRVFYFWHRLGNAVITQFFNMLNNTTFTDIYSCYLMFRRSLIDPEQLRTNGWEQQAEILTKAVQGSRVFYEVPISYHGRTYDEGKKIRARHAVAVLITIARQRFALL